MLCSNQDLVELSKFVFLMYIIFQFKIW